MVMPVALRANYLLYHLHLDGCMIFQNLASLGTFCSYMYGYLVGENSS